MNLSYFSADLKTHLNGIMSLDTSWMLDHPYCAKLLEVKVKQEQAELVDRIKEEARSCSINQANTAHFISNENTTVSMMASSERFIANIKEIVNAGGTKMHIDLGTSSVSSIKPDYSNNAIKAENGESLRLLNNPSTPLSSSATTSRTSSPTTPRRMSMRKKKEPSAPPTCKPGIHIISYLTRIISIKNSYQT